VKYPTSSKYVAKYREDHGEPDVIEVRQTFNDSLQARDWERKVIRRMNAVQDDRWLNRIEPGKKFFNAGHSEETRARISAANRGRTHTPETRARISAACKNPSPEIRTKISASMKRQETLTGDSCKDF
jgi:hypothetical protein